MGRCSALAIFPDWKDVTCFVFRVLVLLSARAGDGQQGGMRRETVREKIFCSLGTRGLLYSQRSDTAAQPFLPTAERFRTAARSLRTQAGIKIFCGGQESRVGGYNFETARIVGVGDRGSVSGS